MSLLKKNFALLLAVFFCLSLVAFGGDNDVRRWRRLARDWRCAGQRHHQP